MAYYLSMDGVDDYLKTPSISFDEVLLDISVNPQAGAWQYLFDARSGSSSYLLKNDAGTYEYNGLTPYVNDVQGQMYSSFIPTNERITLKLVIGSVITDDVNIFSKNNNLEIVGGSIYSISFKNGGSLVARYDMATQTVQDQSGNGNHATLTGGTWVDDGVGGGGSIIDAGTITISAESSLTSSGSRILTSSVDLQDDTTFTVSAQRILNGVSSFSAETDLNAIANKILNGMTTLSGESNLTAEADVLTVGISVNLTAESNLSATGTKVLRGETTLFANGEVIGTGSLVISGEAMLSAESDLSLFIGEYYTQVIEVVLNIKTSADVNLNVKRSADYDLNV